MAVFPSFKLTEKGEELLNRSIGEGKTLTFTKFEIGNGDTPSDFRKQTSLVNKFYEFPILNTSIQKDQVLRIKGYFDNKSFSEDKQLKEIGVYVRLEGVDIDYLYSYTNAGDTGDIIPANSRGFYSRTLDVANYIGYATNITFNIEQLRDRYAFNTENEMKVASYLKVGDKVELWGNLVLGDKPTDEYIIQESGEIELSNGLFAKKVSFKYISQTIEEMQKLALKVGDVVEVLGYYQAGDGAGHKRVIASEDDGSGVQLANGLWANIVHNGEVNVSWFGAKSNINNALIFVKIASYVNSIKTITLNFETLQLEYNPDEYIEQFQNADWRNKTELVDIDGVSIVGNGAKLISKAPSTYKTGETIRREAPFHFRGTQQGSCKNINITGVSQIGVRSDGTYPDNHVNDGNEIGWSIQLCENVTISNLECSNWGTDGIYIGEGYSNLGYSKNVVIKNCILNNNQRQGISGTSFEDLIIEGCLIKNTNGSSFGHAIVLEPNPPSFSKNATISNCITQDNERGFINFIRTLNVTVNNCVCNENISLGTVYCDGNSNNITLNNCIFNSNNSCFYFLGSNIDGFYVNSCKLHVFTDRLGLGIIRQTSGENTKNFVFRNCEITGNGKIELFADNTIMENCRIFLFKESTAPSAKDYHCLKIYGANSIFKNNVVSLDESIGVEENTFYMPYATIQGNIFNSFAGSPMIVSDYWVEHGDMKVLDNYFSEFFYFRNEKASQIIKTYANIQATIPVGSGTVDNGAASILNGGYATTQNNNGAKRGDIILTIGNGYLGYVCTESGNPGIWETMKYVTPTAQLNTPYYVNLMEQEGGTTKQDFYTYLGEKFAYDKQLEAEQQAKYEAYELLLKDNPNLTWEEFEANHGNNVMMNLSLVERLEEPVIPESVKKFMDKYL